MIFPEFFDYVKRVCDEEGISTGYGCSENEIITYKRIAKRQNPGNDICVVSDWTWLESRVDEAFPELFGTNEKIIVNHICANRIIEGGIYHTSNCCLTRKLREFTHDCIFHTKNISYILVGNGRRVIISPAVIAIQKIFNATPDDQIIVEKQ